MRDVAHQAGVSQSTVSFVLNGNDNMRISAETRRRVMKAVDLLGYNPRGAGRPPKSSKLRVIGILFDEVATSPFAAISIEGLQEEAWKSGILVEAAMSGGDRDYENAILRKWAGERIEGVVYASILTRRVKPPDMLARHRAVLMNCYDADGRFGSIVPAERRGGENATRLLLDTGHRRIAFITGEPWMEASDQRMEGHERALRQAGLPVDPSLIVEGNFLPSGGHSATQRLLDNALDIDAIFCANDLMAVGCYEALKERGIAVGQDIAVMGYDDQEIAQHLAPPLSTVLLPHREMAQLAARRLIDTDDAEVLQDRVECPIVIRASHLGRQRQP